MTNSVRSLGILDGRRDSALRWAALALLLAAIGFLFLAPPAGALVISAEGGTKVGILPSNNELLLDGSAAFDRVNNFHFFAGPESFGNPSGNPVVHGANIYAIYWDPTKGDYHGDWERVVDGFLRDVGSSSNQFNSVFSVDTQYTDKTNEPAYDAFSFHGAITDTQPYPTTGNCTDPEPILEWPRSQTKSLGCLTDKQVREQLSSFIAQHGLPTGMHTIYYLLTPPGLTVCLDEGGPGGHCSDFESSKFERSAQTFTTESYEHSFCSYHGAINPDKAESGDGNTLLYGMIPWTAGGLGDGDLALENETYATYCQDGGFNPVSKPRIETWSEEPPKANDQEPNQDTQCPSEDGFCDVGLADLIINQIGVQQQDTVTNPLLNAWQDKFGNEVADECRNFFAPAEGSFTPNPETSAGTLYDQQLGAGRYFINTSFNEASMKLQFPGISCLPGIRLEPHFTAPNVVNAGEIVAFNGQESDITLNANTTFTAGGAPQNNYATYSWNFGDGSPTVSGYAPGTPPCETPWLSPCAASPSHAYQYGGTYEVTLTVKDVGGETEQVVHDVTVVGPAAARLRWLGWLEQRFGWLRGRGVLGRHDRLRWQRLGQARQSLRRGSADPARGDRGRPHTLAAKRPQGRAPRQLLGRPAGRRPLRSAARPERGQAPPHQRPPRDEPARRCGPGGHHRSGPARHDSRRARQGQDLLLQAHRGAAGARAQGRTDAARDRPQPCLPHADDGHQRLHPRPLRPPGRSRSDRWRLRRAARALSRNTNHHRAASNT